MYVYHTAYPFSVFTVHLKIVSFLLIQDNQILIKVIQDSRTTPVIYLIIYDYTIFNCNLLYSLRTFTLFDFYGSAFTRIQGSMFSTHVQIDFLRIFQKSIRIARSVYYSIVGDLTFVFLIPITSLNMAIISYSLAND